MSFCLLTMTAKHFQFGINYRKEFAHRGANYFMNRPCFGKVMLSRKVKRNSQKLFLFVKIVQNMKVYLYTKIFT